MHFEAVYPSSLNIALLLDLLSPTHSLTHTPSHSLTHSVHAHTTPIQSHTHTPAHPLTLTHTPAAAPAHVTRWSGWLLRQLSRALTHTRTLSLTLTTHRGSTHLKAQSTKLKAQSSKHNHACTHKAHEAHEAHEAQKHEGHTGHNGHETQRTNHNEQSTKYEAQCAKRKAQSAKRKAQSPHVGNHAKLADKARRARNRHPTRAGDRHPRPRSMRAHAKHMWHARTHAKRSSG